MAIGERLREARMRQKIDIAEVESATKIRAKYLRALENEEFGLLPGNTFVKTFMRTYADYLGLDAQLLIEEYRVDYEPRDQVELQPYMSPPRRRRQEERRRPRVSRGPPGPGTAALVVVGVVLVIFAILGLTAGGDNNSSSPTTSTTAKKKSPKPKRKPAAPPKPTTVKLRVVPTSVAGVYLCVDRGLGTPIVYQGTTTQPQIFRGKHVRINIGNATTVRVTANGKRVKLPATATIIGYDFKPGRAKPLAPSEKRPCT